MIPITEDELTEVLSGKLRVQSLRNGITYPYPGLRETVSEARRLARLMLASEQMYEALSTYQNANPLHHDLDAELFDKAKPALAAAEGRK